ncbi:hypothetical protein ACFL35_21680 [Candidatus Riflebacteria bacterium]
MMEGIIKWVKNLDLHRHFYYWILPGLITLPMVFLYFSGIPIAEELIAPAINRELGLLENAENIIIIAIIVVAIIGFRRKTIYVERAAFVFIALFSLFIFLEEIDYGLHYYEFLMKKPEKQQIKIRNIHNIGEITDIIKGVVDATIILFFVFGPFVLQKIKHPVIRYLVPDVCTVGTALSMVAVSKFAHLLDSMGLNQNGSLDKNISEFREFFIYYLFLVYLVEIVFRRKFDEEKELYDKFTGEIETGRASA